MTDTPDTIVPPGGLGGPLILWLNRLTLALAALGGLGTLGIMAIINADVIGRGAFGAPIPVTAEIVSAAIVAIVLRAISFLCWNDLVPPMKLFSSSLLA